MAEIELTSENFEEVVGKSEIPVLVDFWATWCGPCRMMSGPVAELAEELAGKVKVCKVNVDEQPELAQKFGIQSIPTFVRFQKGQNPAGTMGAMPKDDLKNFALGV